MNKLMPLVFLLLFFTTVLAYDLNGPCSTSSGSSDFNAIGSCIMQGSFGGDTIFFAVIFLLLFAIFAFQANIPQGATILIGLILTFAIMPMLPPAYYSFLLNIIILVIGLLLGKAILHGRQN